MSDKTLVSVIIPVFRTEKYIRACVDSVLRQTYSNLEIILVDDGSDDGCPEICDCYAGVDERVKVIHKKNGGLSAARNTGISVANGEYLAFVDSDDAVSPEYIEQLLFACQKYDVKLSMCDYMAVRDNFQFLSYKNNILCKKEMQHDVLLKNAESLDARYVIIWNKLFHRSLFDEIHFPEGKLHEDVFTSWKLFLKANDVVFVDAILYYYRKHQESIMGSEFSRQRLDSVVARREIANYHSIHSSAEIALAANRSLYQLLQLLYGEMNKYYPFDMEEIKSLRTEMDDLEARFGEKISRKGIVKSFIFPFQHIPKGQKIIIYGAGAVGREYYRQLETSGWCSYIHITDKYNITSFPPTRSLDCIISEDYDVLLIALENHTVAEQVRKMLLDLGVLESKILWFSPNVDSLDESYRKPILWERLSQNLLKESSSDRVYLMNTPDHGNLGDHALAIAGTNELKKRFPKAEVCEVTGCQWDWFKGKIIPIVQKQEDIFINAGGSMGSLWKYEDSRIKDIIRSFPDNRIVILPQSIYFDADTSASELALEKNFYETYKNVHIIFRERNSYNWFRENIISADGRSSLEPDLALKIKINIESKREKNGVLCCFREDHESVLSNLFIENLCRFFNETEKIDYKFISTVVDHMILPEDREAELSEFLRRVAEARLVITDRLHAMVFAKLVGTPCIALDNISKKVSGVYEWISDCPYVICTKEDIVTPKLIMEYYEKGETKWV